MLNHVKTLGEVKIYQDTRIEQDIRERAYFKWLEAGCPDGHDNEFWLSAEREILFPTFSNLGQPTMGEGVICCPYIPKEFNSPVVEGLDFSTSEEVTIELTKRYEPLRLAARTDILTRFGKKLLDKLKGRNANSETIE